MFQLEDRLNACKAALEDTPLVLLTHEEEEASHQSTAIIKSEFCPLTPSNTPQYSISRSDTPSPPNAQRYTIHSGNLRLSPVPRRNSGSSSAGTPSPAKRFKEDVAASSSTVLVHSLESGGSKVTLERIRILVYSII